MFVYLCAASNVEVPSLVCWFQADEATVLRFTDHGASGPELQDERFKF